MGKCVYCCKIAVTNLDGDDLCQKHADDWVRSEGRAAEESLEDYLVTLSKRQKKNEVKNR